MEEHSYWNHNGELQELYDKLSEELVPDVGNCKTLQGEVLRAASKLYYRWFNDGDRIQDGGYKPEFGPSVMNAFGFLLAKADSNIDLRKLQFNALLRNVSNADSEEEYEEALEELATAAIRFAGTKPLIPNEEDMLEDYFQDLCISRCNLGDEEEEDEDYSDDFNDEELW